MTVKFEVLPITALSFDSTLLLNEDGSVFLRIKKGLGEIPAVRGVDTVVPGRRGRIARNRVADHLSIELEGIVAGQEDLDDHSPTEPESYYAIVRSLVALFDPEADPKVLSATYPDGSVATINARVIPPLLWDEQISGRLAILNVALESVDPDWTITPPP